MEPLIALITATLASRMLGPLLSDRLRDNWLALRVGLAAMFVVTGLAHFVGLRDGLVSMVPPSLPAPELLVTVTGVMELAGAAALLHGRTYRWAAAGLALLLVAVFPANVHAASAEMTAVQAESLGVRTALQLVFLSALVAVWWPRAARRRSIPTLADATRA